MCTVLQLPVNLLRAGRVFVFEPPPGVRANLLRTFSTLPPSRMSRVSTGFITVFHVLFQAQLLHALSGCMCAVQFIVKLSFIYMKGIELVQNLLLLSPVICLLYTSDAADDREV